MEKNILILLISLIGSYLTSADIFASYGVVCCLYVFAESIIWLIHKIYFNKEKNPSQIPGKND